MILVDGDTSLVRKEVSRTAQDIETFCCLSVLVMVTSRRVILFVDCNSFFIKCSGG